MLNLRKLLGIIILMVLCVVVINAQSQQPSPGPGELSKPIQNNTIDKQQPAEADKRGTEQSPFIVKTINPPKTEAEAEQDRKDREEKAANDRHLVWFTGALVFVAIFQFGALILQAIYLNKGFKATAKAAKAAQDSADVLPIMERAYIFVEVRLKELFKEPVIDHNFCEFVIKNYGKTPAILTYIEGFANVFGDYIPQKIKFERTGIMPYSEIIIESGGEIFFDIDCISSLTNEKIDAVKKMARLICFGAIHYEDIFGKCHETGFCWVYSIISHNFHFLDNPNNYRT